MHLPSPSDWLRLLRYPDTVVDTEPDEVARAKTRWPLFLPERTLRGAELTATVASRIVGGRDRDAVGAYVDLVRSQMNDGEEDNGDPIENETLQPLTGGRSLTTNVKPQTRTLRAFLAMFCSVEYWGGALEAEQHSLRDVVQRFEQGSKAEPFDPYALIEDRKSMVDLLTNIDGRLNSQPGLRATWDDLATARAELVNYLDLLIAEPIGLLYTNERARQAMARYLDAYAELLRLLAVNRGDLNAHFSVAYRAIVQGLLRLDIVFVATPGEKAGDDDLRWKALLTPLHPLHLWRYRTILEKTGPHLTEQEQRQLAEALPELPHLLHFVAVKDARLGRITLPLAGALEGLPIYENRTNRYLGSDGLTFLGDLLRSWLAFAPYSQPHIRLALIDPPYLPDALREVKDFLRGRPYAPLAAVPLVEQLQGRREVAVWAHATSRSVSQFAVMLRERYNLLPDEQHLVRLMQKFGHIAAGGLFSAVRANNLTASQSDKQRKGLVGTVLAAHWYTTQHPGALIASLDSGLARQWLALQAASRERADLIGLRQDEQGNLIIDIIEVKAVEHAQKEVQVRFAPPNRQVTLTGPAVNQLRATLNVVTPIFQQGQDQLDLFGQARREALKYQLYRECYREMHDNDDQFRWHKLLNAAFRELSASVIRTVRCHGLVVHLSFEENGADERYLDSTGDVTLMRLRAPSIQALLKPSNGASPVGPPSPMPPTPQPAPPQSIIFPPQIDATAETLISQDKPGTQAVAPVQPVLIPDEAVQAKAELPSFVQVSAMSAAVSSPAYDILLGDTKPSRQYGLLGRAGNKTVALDLNGTNTISIFGVQGGGKSYTVGSVVEMATQFFPRTNVLPSPLASVIFHYHASQDYPPEFVSMVSPNSQDDEVRTLQQEYGASPGRLEDVLILTSADKVADRQAEFPSIRVEPILFSSSELSLTDWQFLMGVFGNQMYMKQVTLIMRRLRPQLTLAGLREETEASDLGDNQKALVSTRLDFAEPFIDDKHRLAAVLRPGRLVIVDLRDELISKEEALGLFVVMLNIFANAGRGQNFNKLIVFDEAHKYMNDVDLAGYIVDVVRQMRHQGVSILIASQDPPSLPNAIIELSTLVILHRFNSPKWLKHVQASITALSDLQPDQLANLRPGEAYVWAVKATDNNFMRHAVKLRFRPRVTQHGGGTKTAVDS